MPTIGSVTVDGKSIFSNIEADLISKSAKDKLEKIGGSILIKKIND